MLKAKPKECLGCGELTLIWSKGMCKYCAAASSTPKLKKTKMSTSRKPTGEMAFFETLWNVRERVSFLSGKPVSFSPSTFAHVLPKSKYPKLRLYDRNIIFLTQEEHTLLDAGTKEQRERYAKEYLCDWNSIYKLKEELLKETQDADSK
jgi:hypothetical protein